MKRFLDNDISDEELESACDFLSSGMLERRAFLKKAGLTAGGLVLGGSLAALAGCGGSEPANLSSVPSASSAPASSAPSANGVDLAVATGGRVGDMARRAVDALGSMKAFVKPGYTVVIKPNASFMDGPEAATSTHPDVVDAVVSMCKEAGANRVIVMDHCLRGSPEACLEGNGIGPAAEKAGAKVIAYDGGDRGHGVRTAISGGVALR